LEGKYGIDKYTGLVLLEEKQEDVIRLTEYYNDWSKKLATNRHSDNILNEVAAEIKDDLRFVKRLLDEKMISSKEYAYKIKSITLQSKYTYLVTQAFFDEYQSEVVICNFHGQDIEINAYSFVHILNRHLAKSVKQFPTG